MAKAPKPPEIVRDTVSRITLPDGMSYADAIQWIQRQAAAEERTVTIVETLAAYPYDGAFAFKRAADELFGWSQSANPTWVKLPVDAMGNTVDVFIGSLRLPGIDGVITTSPDWSGNGFVIEAGVKTKDKPKADALIRRTKELLKTSSLYLGRAFRVGYTSYSTPTTPEFINLNGPQTVILNSDTQYLLDAVLFTPIRRAAEMRRLNIPRPRGVLLSGTYGTGKSLTATLLAQLCEQTGHTFILCTNPAGLVPVYRLAERYAPAYVFCEDIDRLEDTTTLTSILDGVDAKAADVSVVFTTNHIEKLSPALLRHGRLDTVVFFEPPNAETAARLVRHYGGEHLASDFDAAAAGRVLAGLVPATIREAVERAKRFAVSHLPDGAPLVIRTEDVTRAADGMRAHLALIDREPQPELSNVEKAAYIRAEGDKEAARIIASNGVRS